MKKILAAAIILLAAGTALFSQEIENLGFNILSTGTDDGYNVVTAQDPATGLTVDLYYTQFTQSNSAFLAEAKKIIQSWRYLVPEEIQIFFQPDQVEIRVIPKSFTYGGTDFARYIPSAVNFYFETILEYDFRILVENITLRVRGPYFNEDQLAAKLQSAVANPIAYIQTNDPEYIVRRLGEMSAEMEELKAAKTEAEKKIAALTEELEALSESYGELAGTVESELEGLRLGTIAAANQGLFSSIKDFNSDAVGRAIALKAENPSFTEDELLSACKERDIEVSSKEVHLIFLVYFNEF